MSVYDRPVWQLMQEFAADRPGQFRFAELESWFRDRYPAVQAPTLRAHLQRMTVGNGASGLPSVFDRIEHGLYRAVPRQDQSKPTALTAPLTAASADVVLITCVKTKLSVPAAAKDLYISALFQKQRQYAERSGATWFILSAEHGLVRPEEWLAPYERYLPDCPPSYRNAWAQWSAARLELLLGTIAGKTIEIHASSLYASCLTPALQTLGAIVSTPLAGLAQGQRLAWYGSAVEGASSSRPTKPPPDDQVVKPARASDAIVAVTVTKLLDQTQSRGPAELRRMGKSEMSAPGLYSWWVDAHGAGDLSAGLGVDVRPGLVYAGQAGATRWPSGRQSANTLWARLVGMHLDGSAAFSTFRLTLASVLREPLELEHVDDPAVTEWMENHLCVIAVAVEDADSLMSLEHEVLDELDPPLNLSGRAPTPVRRRLSQLRREIR
ncbi:MAG TPA: hypothetical protein VFG33_07965 [Kribbella sp.]|uniref:DUF6884 domain-containing protein n=1 Tax=Kribbella sp. TaxID=1871183 RepID=UPI002D78E1BE|nr:DUF6884 domain-containing protein [Kribbella sp.]HET6293294.1 hypothetical protein [Kribbella sp.]